MKDRGVGVKGGTSLLVKRTRRTVVNWIQELESKVLAESATEEDRWQEKGCRR